MSLIDSRGRLFGRLNLIDAALVVFILALLPLGYTAYRVFRVRQPQIERVEPAQVPVGPAERLRLVGHDFRPYLRVFVNQARQPFSVPDRDPERREGRLLVETPDVVEIRLPPNLEPGPYDIFLFDESQEVARQPNAFTVTPLPASTVEATVRFAVMPEVADLVRVGDRDLARTPAEEREGRAALQEVHPAAAVAPAIDLRKAPGGRAWFSGQPSRALDAKVAIPASRSAAGIWEYRLQPVRPGDLLTFETERYVMHGTILQLAAVAAGDR